MAGSMTETATAPDARVGVPLHRLRVPGFAVHPLHRTAYAPRPFSVGSSPHFGRFYHQTVTPYGRGTQDGGCRA